LVFLNVIIVDIKLKQKIPQKSSSKFKQRRNAHEPNENSKNTKDKVHRYDQNEWINQSSFLGSILDRSSCIFSIRSKKQKDLEIVRKKIDTNSGRNKFVLYDEDIEKNANELLNQSINQSEETDMVKIGHEISAYLQSNTSGFNFAESSEVLAACSIPNFKVPSNCQLKSEDYKDDVPKTPDMTVYKSSIKSLKDKLEEIITVSEIFQPSEDEIAERILSQNEDPFNLNFNLESGLFEINFDKIPEDNRNEFVAKCDFS
jgi:hypothetical protein